MTDMSVSSERGSRKVRSGVVVSDKMDKTIVVAVQRLVRHPMYGKVMRQTRRIKAHDQENVASVGDYVQVMETRPISREKRWRLVEVTRTAR